MRRIATRRHTSLFALAAVAALLLAAPIGARAQNLFVSGQDPQGNGVVLQYSPTGADLGVFASVGQGAALGLAFTGSGDLLVANNLTNTIHRFSPTGADLGVFASTGLNNVQALAINGSGDVFAANYGDGTIHEFSPTGADLGTFVNVSRLGLPIGIGFNSSGDLYVSASRLSSGSYSFVLEYSPTGTLLFGNYYGFAITGLAVNAGGDVFVDNLETDHFAGVYSVSEWSPTLGLIGSFGDLNTPYGNAFNSSGDLFTADGDGTVHEFSPTNADLGTFVSTRARGVNPFFLAFSSPAATPEPGSLALAVGALVPGAALLYRRRRNLSAK